MQNKHNRLTISNNHEEILSFRMKVSTLEFFSAKENSDFSDLAAAATWLYR